jgi:pimeloyl-ACP methyl ester carboxylesterase
MCGSVGPQSQEDTIAASSLVRVPDVLAARLPEESWGDWLLTFMGSTLDATMLQAMRFVVDAVMMPRPEELPALRASAEPYLSGELWEEPRRFFSFVDTPVAPVAVSDRYRRSRNGGTMIGREFTTAYQPYHLSEEVIGVQAPRPDRVLVVEHWIHEPSQRAGTVVALHGFSMGYPRMDAFALFATQCFRAGLDVALVTLPFHGSRTPPDARFSGERFAVPHVARLNEAVRQAIYEIHLLVGWLRQQTGAPVGLLGLSLGGYLSALMAGLTADLDFVIPMVPPVCMGDLAWRFFSRSRKYRSTETAALPRDELRAAYRVHSPLTYPRQVDKRRLLILAGRGDQIVPPEHPHTLWRHWDEPAIDWFSGSHLAPFGRGRLCAVILEHVQRCVAH